MSAQLLTQASSRCRQLLVLVLSQSRLRQWRWGPLPPLRRRQPRWPRGARAAARAEYRAPTSAAAASRNRRDPRRSPRGTRREPEHKLNGYNVSEFTKWRPSKTALTEALQKAS